MSDFIEEQGARPVSIIKAGSSIIVTKPEKEGKSNLIVFDAKAGKEKWRKALVGEVVENGLAACDGGLFVTMKSGEVLGFRGK